MKNFGTLTGIVLLLQGLYGEKYTVAKGSQVSYRVNAKAVFGLITHTIIGRNDSLSGEFELNDGLVRGKLHIPVLYFESGNTRRDKDVARILKVDEFPFIVVEVDSIDTTTVLKGTLNHPVKIPVYLKIAGVKRKIEMYLGYDRVNDTLAVVVVSGETKFTDFNISPPRIRGLGAIGKVITYAPDQVFLNGKIFIKRIRRRE